VISGIGKNGQFVSFSKEHDLVMIRMGQAPDSLGYVPNFYMSDLWKLTMDVACRATSVEESIHVENEPVIMHDDMIRFTSLRTDINRITVYDMNGRSMHLQYNQDPINVGQFPIGVYTVVISSTKGNTNHLIVKK
ncbi:MAG: T9SS type A sorting domain-containing protein, partial [Ignavibacteria bacterium]